MNCDGDGEQLTLVLADFPRLNTSKNTRGAKGIFPPLTGHQPLFIKPFSDDLSLSHWSQQEKRVKWHRINPTASFSD
jgi:hypothetical protein